MNEELIAAMNSSVDRVELVARLRAQAKQASDISRQMAEAKSLRQDGNHERRADLYMWQSPEQTIEWQAADLIEALTSGDSVLGDAQIKHMANRFLMWRLPENFHPDAGISFKPTFNDHMDPPMRHNPIGTNLFDADQAEQMVRHMIDEMPVDTNEAPLLDEVRSYAEAAMQHGWKMAVRAAMDGRLEGGWERRWFELNPPPTGRAALEAIRNPSVEGMSR